LTDLDSRFEEMDYPTITMKNKKNHNPEFDKYLTEQEQQEYVNEFEDQLRDKISELLKHSEGSEKDYKKLKAFVKKIAPEFATDHQIANLIDKIYKHRDDDEDDDDYLEFHDAHGDGLHKGGMINSRSEPRLNYNDLNVRQLREMVHERYIPSIGRDKSTILTSQARKEELVNHLENPIYNNDVTQFLDLISDNNGTPSIYRNNRPIISPISSISSNSSNHYISTPTVSTASNHSGSSGYRSLPASVQSGSSDGYSLNSWQSGSSGSSSRHSSLPSSVNSSLSGSSGSSGYDSFPNSNPSSDNADKKKKDQMALITNQMKNINNAITNLLLFFKGSIAQSVNSLNRRQIEKISEENEALRPKIQELLSDEFVHKFHVPQIKTIEKNSNDLYITINNACKSYVQPRMNGAGLHFNNNTHVPIINHRYYL